MNLSQGQEDTVRALTEVIGEGRCVLLGAIRQELLQGISAPKEFEQVCAHLAEFTDEPVWSSDYVLAARMYNRCRSKGVHAATIEMLICAVATRLKAAVFTLDRDFLGYHRVVGVQLFKPTLH